MGINMDVAYFASDLFVPVAAVSMASLMENNQHMEQIHIYFIEDGVTPERLEQLIALVSRYGRQITVITAPAPDVLFGIPFRDRYQMGHSYVRMCLGKLLPKEVERVLCLDGDTLVLNRLDELWQCDLGDNLMAGVADCLNLKAYRSRFGLTGDAFYSNAGVFLLDLKKWREEQIEDQINAIIKKKNGNIFFFEQTLMNYVCAGRVLRLHPRYNCYTAFYAFDYENLMLWRKPTNFYTRTEVQEALAHPAIIHFTRNFYLSNRPWTEGCSHPATGEYRRYMGLTPYQEIIKEKTSWKGRLKRMVCRLLPKRILVLMAGWLYNSVRPHLWWRNE